MDGSRPASPRSVRHRPAPQLPGSPDNHPLRGHGRTGSRGVYHDAAVEELCRIETFQQGYNSKDLLAGLSEKLIARSRADPSPFNPRPFIRTFEASVDSLLALRSNLTAQTTTLSSSVRVAESAYTSKLHDLSSHFTSASTSFTALESRFSEVGRTAIHIGEQLQTIDKMRTRAAEAHDLIEYYYQFARGDTSRLERLRKEGGREGRLKTAIIARRLSAIAKEVDIKGAEQTRDTIDQFAERFERDMLKLFDRFYRKSDPKMMSHIAKVLQNFNGGQSCVQIYVNQHDFFISKDRIIQRREVEESAIWNTLSDPDSLPPKSEASLQALFSEIRSTVEVEAQIISAVFPNPLIVMSTFLQRVFAQSVQGYVEVLMRKAAEVGAAATLPGTTTSSESHLAFLRTLQLARNMSLHLVNDLKVYDFKGAGIVSTAQNGDGGVLNDSSNLNVQYGSRAAAVAAGTSALGVMLDQAVDELFVPYMEGVKYLERESRSLTELYAAYLLRFSNYHRAAHHIKSSTIFDRVRTQIATNTTNSSLASTTGTSTATKGTSFGFSKLSNLVDRARVAAGAASSATSSSTDLTLVDGHNATEGDASGESEEERDGELNLEVAERMLRWHAEAIGRCVDLSSSSEVAKNTFSLLKVLSEAYIKSYVEIALDSALARANAQEARGVALPDLRDLSVVRQVDLILQLWQHYVGIALLPLATSSVTIRREMAIFNNYLLLRVEKKCDSVVQKIADNVVAFLSGRLSTQKKNDFTPKNDELAFSRINTDPCLACVEALEKVEQMTRSGLGGGKNADTFLTEIGVAFHSLLLDHLRKFTISAAGGIMLTKDLAMYQDAISSFGIPALSDRFEMLRQLGNLFIVQPAVLKSYMRESHLSKIEERLLRPYLLRRADYSSHVRDLNELGNANASTIHGTSSNGIPTNSNEVTLNGVAQGAVFGGAGISESEKELRLKSVLTELEKWSKEEDGQISTRNSELMESL
ncbi:hypothetical protein CBS101457_001737 [Exobasidium rhododendri]|nr:hypothetical protein CBS101457_001737 [Exobasidium rhododendri]